MDNVENFMKHLERKRHLKSMADIDTSALNTDQLKELCGTLSKMVLDLSSLVEISAANIADLAQRQLEMQQQFMLVSGQAYTSLEIMRQKNICTDDDIKNTWEQILREKMTKPQDDPEASDQDVQDSVSEADLEDLQHT